MTSRISSVQYHTSLVATLYTAGLDMAVEGQRERDTMANMGHGVWMSHRTHTHRHKLQTADDKKDSPTWQGDQRKFVFRAHFKGEKKDT